MYVLCMWIVFVYMLSCHGNKCTFSRFYVFIGANSTTTAYHTIQSSNPEKSLQGHNLLVSYEIYVNPSQSCDNISQFLIPELIKPPYWFWMNICRSSGIAGLYLNTWSPAPLYSTNKSQRWSRFWPDICDVFLWLMSYWTALHCTNGLYLPTKE